MDGECAEVGDDLVAGRVLVGAQQLVVIVAHLLRHAELQLRDVVAVGGAHVGIGHLADVEHDVVVARVAVVAVLVPVAGAVVNLDVAHPEGAADAYLGVEEVGPGVAVVQSRVDDFHFAAVGCRQLFQRQHLVLPSVVQEYLHKPESLVFAGKDTKKR